MNGTLTAGCFLLTALAASAETLSGTVSTTNGMPLAGIPVEVLRISPTTGNVVRYNPARTNTDLSGSFTTIDLGANSYWVRAANAVKDSDGVLVPTGYEGLYYHPLGSRPTRDPLSPIVLTGSFGNVAGLDIALRPAVSVTGHVTTPAAVDYTLVDFDVFDASSGDFSPLINAAADTNGNYVLHGLPAGSHHVRCDPSTSLGFYEVYQGDVFLEEDAVPLTVAAANLNLDFHLDYGFPISGTIRDAGGPLGDMDIDLYAISGLLSTFVPGVMRTVTNPPGEYATILLPSGMYTVRADPGPGSFLVQGYYTTSSIPALAAADATPVQVTGHTVTNVDIALIAGGRISGRVQTNGMPIATVDIDVYDTSGQRMSADAKTGADGVYDIGALPAGAYLVRADTDPAGFLVAEYYTHAWVAEDGTPVAVSAGQTTTNVDFDLTIGGRIAGTITQNGGTPVAGVDLDVFVGLDTFMEVTAFSGTNGAYSVGALPAGTYLVRADTDPSGFLVAEYYTGAWMAEDATPLTVATGVVTTNVDFSLTTGGRIAGAITDRFGTPLFDIDLDVLSGPFTLAEVGAHSGTNGQYSVGALPVGSYRVRADPEPTQPYVRQYFSDAPGRERATLVQVTAGTVTNAVDFRLDTGGTISGRVTSLSGTPLDAIDLDAFDGLGVLQEQSAKTGADGSYLLGALLPGPYSVRADPGADSPWVYAYYSNALFETEATPVSVVGTQATSDVGFHLRQGGFIAGNLLTTSLLSTAGIDMDMFDLAGRRLDVGGASDVGGFYRLGALPVGSFLVRADPAPMQFLARTYYPNAATPVAAEAVVVLPGQTNAPRNIVMPGAGVITGTIRDTNGAALAGIDLDAFQALTGERVDGDASSKPDGTYVFGPVRPGDYVVRADPNANQFYVREYYHESPSMLLATSVPVAVAVVTTNVNMSLSPGASVSGTVSGKAGYALEHIDIDVFPVNGGAPLEQTALSRVDGRYAVGPLPEGQWAVRAHPNAAQGYETRYYDGAGNISNASPVTILGGYPVGGIDFLLGTNYPPSAGFSSFGGFLSPSNFVLSASASTDANGDRLLYSWRQVDGPAVGIETTDVASVSVTLPPGTPAGAVLTFEVTAYDFSTSSVPATVSVRVGAPLITGITATPWPTVAFRWTLSTARQPYTVAQSMDLVTWSNILQTGALRYETQMVTTQMFFRILTQ